MTDYTETAREKPKMMTYYCGQPVKDMTREELIETVESMGRLMTRDRETHSFDLDMLSLSAEATGPSKFNRWVDDNSSMLLLGILALPLLALDILAFVLWVRP